MNPASLSGSALDVTPCCCAEPAMSVGDDQAHPVKAAHQ